MNYQFADPAKKCQDPFGLITWKMHPLGFGTRIHNGTPCFMATVRPALSSTDEWLEVTWEWFLSNPNQDRNVILHWQDKDNWIGIHTFAASVFFEGRKNGVGFVNGLQSYPFRPNTTYAFRVREHRQTGFFQVWINSVQVLETTLPHAKDIPARPGLAASVGGVSSSDTYFRNFRIWTTPERNKLTHWKQTSAPWGGQEYDSAQKWSEDPPTIARWGCAMTSAAMILDSMGVKVLPNGDPLNPGTLNAWLKSEPDGYLGQGFLNWRAISRLSKWHNQQYGTASLEFHSARPAEGDKIAWLKTLLEKRIPVILEQPGHFVVASNSDPSNGNIEILDPSFSKTSLADYNSTYLSARVFTPSATNLQGATLLLPYWVKPTLRTTSGQEIPMHRLETQPYQTHTDQQTDISDPEWQLWDVEPWGNGELVLTIDAPMPVPLSGAWYTTQGVAQTVPSIITPDQPAPLSQNSPPLILTDEDIAKLLSWEEIKTPAIWLWRRQVLDSEPGDHAREKEAYIWLLEQAYKSKWISSVAYELLLTETDKFFGP